MSTHRLSQVRVKLEKLKNQTADLKVKEKDLKEVIREEVKAAKTKK